MAIRHQNYTAMLWVPLSNDVARPSRETNVERDAESSFLLVASFARDSFGHCLWLGASRRATFPRRKDLCEHKGPNCLLAPASSRSGKVPWRKRRPGQSECKEHAWGIAWRRGGPLSKSVRQAYLRQQESWQRGRTKDPDRSGDTELGDRC